MLSEKASYKIAILMMPGVCIWDDNLSLFFLLTILPRRRAVSLDTAAGRVSYHSSRGGGNGIQFLKQLNGVRSASRERGGLKHCASFWGRHSARSRWKGAKRGPEPPPHEWLTLLSSEPSRAIPGWKEQTSYGPTGRVRLLPAERKEEFSL